ncbi:U3 small nucleolar ribonucleoprotein MPP10 [Plasmodium falciparum NF54]|uniref:U3 small nucleolar ribonucleoprotein protein MPP10, putative n=2 Tax=Plasmodium falciparum TaxID=5833 RepID=Q8IJD2_PLAF7|nr:U3 small nucleolar ribonucleoprotein protein MPP10, putative [Plasmodium falciparum 3D7]KAF4328117.1 U3 small nucleolar ribonucleoprotein MPP10 [Plasmodium falciparum NF54]PKC43512.1 U3 small nucleolar ribonucleoprotein MPP10 [Plasmodium falciparum NF54]CZT98525.1 U3 small nucleolar ribonucleoprotein protein MPP10, putative [Plasmodium falciparum 3D7]|eukprot:XP_001347550.1 U3 small nucleolar ribonucleoprotein protein MPP10, putative [Plasmodium falciparum 3D7]
MDEGKVKKYTDFINSFTSFDKLGNDNKCSFMENKESLVDMIEYFCNFLIKYFYNDINMDSINIKESNLDAEQLWYLIECLIKKKNLNNLLEFFKRYEKQIDQEKCNKKKEKKIMSPYKINRDLNELCDDNTFFKTSEEKPFSEKEKEVNKKKKRENNMSSGDHGTKKRKEKNSSRNKESEINKKENNKNDEINHRENLEEDENQDRFFNFDEMESFLNNEENKMLKINEREEKEMEKLNGSYEFDENEETDEEEFDLNNFEDTYEDAKKMKYADFYKDDNEDDEDDEDNEDDEDDDEDDEDNDDDYNDDEDNDDYNDDEDNDDEDDEDNDDEDNDDDDNYDDDNYDEDNDDDDNYDDDNYDDDNYDDDNYDDNYDDDKAKEESYEKKKLYDKKIEQDIYEINQFDSRLSDNEKDSLSNEFNDNKKTDDVQEKEKIEKELVAEKHWSLKGEAYGYNRPKNSILNLNFEIPKLNTFNNNNTLENKNVGDMENTDDDDDDDEKEYASEDGHNKNNNTNSYKKKEKKMNTLNNEIEIVVKQRIQNMLFDDVEKKTIEDIELEEFNKNDEINFDNLNFSKSKISLVDEYTQKYQDEIMNSQSKNKENNLQKMEIMNLFKKIMHACDSLSNDYFIPKPILLNNKNNKMATLNIEDSVPMILSDKNKKTAEEIFNPQHMKQQNELTKDEKKAIRKSKKMKKKKKILNQFKQTGSSINQLVKRNTEIINKNKKNKDQKINYKKYGVLSKDHILNTKTGNRYNFGSEISKALKMDQNKNKK